MISTSTCRMGTWRFMFTPRRPHVLVPAIGCIGGKTVQKAFCLTLRARPCLLGTAPCLSRCDATYQETIPGETDCKLVRIKRTVLISRHCAHFDDTRTRELLQMLVEGGYVEATISTVYDAGRAQSPAGSQRSRLPGRRGGFDKKCSRRACLSRSQSLADIKVLRHAAAESVVTAVTPSIG